MEHAIIEQKDSSICFIQGKTVTPVPIASIACLILGPGTTITHRAIEAMSDSGCLLVWSGDHIRTWYASGMDENRQSKNTLTQATFWADKAKHMEIVRKMYKKRFPDMDMRGLSLESMRGAEGLRMKEIYQKYAVKYGVPWAGRKYDRSDFDSEDTIQQYLTIGNKLLYNVCHAGVVAMGFSPVFGFIHTGTMRSFVYDMADLYKTDIVIPVAFDDTSKHKNAEGLRHDIRSKMEGFRLMKHIEQDLMNMFNAEDIQEGNGALWNGNENVAAGRNYANNL